VIDGYGECGAEGKDGLGGRWSVRVKILEEFYRIESLLGLKVVFNTAICVLQLQCKEFYVGFESKFCHLCSVVTQSLVHVSETLNQLANLFCAYFPFRSYIFIAISLIGTTSVRTG